MDEKLLSLPWQIQVALGCGYTAYILAYSGIRDHHKGIDTAFRATAFGLVATLVLFLTPDWRAPLAIMAAFMASVATGLIWRRWGVRALQSTLRGLDVSWADDMPSAWATIALQNNRHPVSQIAVHLDDGTWLNCADTRPFVDDPFGPCTMGANGDVALYVTQEIEPDGTSSDNPGIRHPSEGVRITYVPASRVRRVTIRHAPLRSASPLETAAAE